MIKRYLISIGVLVIFLVIAVRLVYLEQFYSISMKQAKIETRLATECKFTTNTPHCYVLTDQLENTVKKWAAFNSRWHRNNK